MTTTWLKMRKQCACSVMTRMGVDQPRAIKPSIPLSLALLFTHHSVALEARFGAAPAEGAAAGCGGSAGADPAAARAGPRFTAAAATAAVVLCTGILPAAGWRRSCRGDGRGSGACGFAIAWAARGCRRKSVVGAEARQEIISNWYWGVPELTERCPQVQVQRDREEEAVCGCTRRFFPLAGYSVGAQRAKDGARDCCARH